MKPRRETKPKRKTRQMGKEQGRVAVRKRGGELRTIHPPLTKRNSYNDKQTEVFRCDVWGGKKAESSASKYL